MFAGAGGQARPESHPPVPIVHPTRIATVFCLYLDRVPTEFRVLSVHDATLRDPKIKYTASYTKRAIQNHHVLA